MIGSRSGARRACSRSARFVLFPSDDVDGQRKQVGHRSTKKENEGNHRGRWRSRVESPAVALLGVFNFIYLF